MRMTPATWLSHVLRCDLDNLIENLRSFNAKERFFLVGQVLGNPELRPSFGFLLDLGNRLDLQIPENVFAAMDYHLDWVYASLIISRDMGNARAYLNTKNIVRAQQEDVDFLIAFDAANETHLVFLEAKGVTGWSTKQMNSKIERYRQIFGDDGKAWPYVTPHFAMLSPDEPQRLISSVWLSWMAPNGKVPWMRLSISDKLKRVTRCNQDGRSNRSGAYWTVKSRN